MRFWRAITLSNPQASFAPPNLLFVLNSAQEIEYANWNGFYSLCLTPLDLLSTSSSSSVQSRRSSVSSPGRIYTGGRRIACEAGVINPGASPGLGTGDVEGRARLAESYKPGACARDDEICRGW